MHICVSSTGNLNISFVHYLHPTKLESFSELAFKNARNMKTKRTILSLICRSFIGGFDGDVSTYIRKVSNRTRKTVYLLSSGRSNKYSWKFFNPKEISSSNQDDCRYYITILSHGNGHFDRIVPKTGCNCQLAPPFLEADLSMRILYIKVSKSIEICTDYYNI